MRDSIRLFRTSPGASGSWSASPAQHSFFRLCMVLSMLMVLLPAANLPTVAQEHPHGRLAFVDRNRNLWVIDADGANRRQLTFDGKYDQELDWSFDGQYLAYVYFHSRGDRAEDWEHTLRVVHVGSAQVVYELQDAWPLEWYPWSHRLEYFYASQGQTLLLDADTLTAEPVLEHIQWQSPVHVH